MGEWLSCALALDRLTAIACGRLKVLHAIHSPRPLSAGHDAVLLVAGQ